MRAIRISESARVITAVGGTTSVISKSSQTTHARPWRSALGALLLTTTGLATAVLAIPSPAAAQAARSYNIPAGSLADTINSFAEQSGAQILYDAALTQGRSSAGLQGQYGVAEGLSRLLAGSGVTFRQTGANIFTLEAAPRSAEGAIQLGPVRVEGASGEAGAYVPPQAVIGNQPEAYAGGLVARGGRLGVLGNRDFMDAPFNQSSYTSKLIENQQTQSIVDLLTNDPSVTIDSYRSGAFEEVTIRGFTNNGTNNGRATVNGVYGILGVAPESLERVDVLKGPSAFLHGTGPTGNTVGGTINLVTKRAPDEPITRLTTTYASDAEFGGHLDFGRRFGENKEFGLRFNGRYRAGDTALEHNSEKLGMASLGLDYRSERVRLTADLGYDDARIDGVRRFLFVDSGVPVPRAPESSSNYSPPWTYQDRKTKYGMVQGEVDIIDNVTAFASFATSNNEWSEYGFISSIYNIDGDANGSAFAEHEKTIIYTWQAGIRSEFDTGPLHHKLNFDFTKFTHKYYFSGNYDYASFETNIYEKSNVPDQGAIIYPAEYIATTNQSGVGIADTVSVLEERVQLTIGARRQEVGDAKAWTPIYALVVKPLKNISLYTSYIEGLEGGEIAGVEYANAGETFPPNRYKQHEVGIKADWGMLATTISAFEITVPGYISVPGTSLPTLTLDGKQINRGIEINVFGEPVKGVRLQGGVMLMDPELKKTQDGAYDGNRPVGTPTVNFALSGEWDTPLSGFTLTGRVNHTGKSFYDAANTQVLPSATRVDLGARYAFKAWDDRPITVRFDVQNVAGSDYWYPFGALTVSQPRTFLLSATFDF
ncbi:TonB-dependent receptor [Sphingobium terrigena]|nr:TonB-dependent receptor [Sphingobium terrigena]